MLDLAILSEAAYKDSPLTPDKLTDPIPEGWHEMPPDELVALGIDPALLEDKRTGFHAVLFQEPNGSYVIAFRGTELSSAKDDLSYLRGESGVSPQEQDAIRLGATVQTALAKRGATLEMTGHSLGGALAAVAAIATGTHATTFNAAGVADGAIQAAEAAKVSSGLGFPANSPKELVTNIQVLGDPVSNAQHILHLLLRESEAVGTQLTVPYVGGSLSPIDPHSSDQVVKSLQNAVEKNQMPSPAGFGDQLLATAKLYAENTLKAASGLARTVVDASGLRPTVNDLEKLGSLAWDGAKYAAPEIADVAGDVLGEAWDLTKDGGDAAKDGVQLAWDHSFGKLFG
jgi:hypothetical protein